MDQGTQQLCTLASRRLSFEYQSGGVTRVEPGHTTGWRTLPCLVTACMSYPAQVHFTDGQVVPINPGQAICVMPNRRHCIRTPATGGISRWSHVSYQLTEGVDLFGWLSLPLVLSGSIAQRIGQINAALARLREPPSPSLSNLARCQALGFELLALLVPRAQIKPETGAWLQHNPGWAAALEFIARNLAAPLDVPRLAALAHVSVSWFHRQFRLQLGQTPSQYVRQLRLRRAQQLLLASDQPVKQIAASVGYHDLFNFSRAFKRDCGVSPATYRAQARDQKI